MTDQAHATYTFGPYTLEPAEWRLRCGEEMVSLPPKAFALLHVLVTSAGGLVTKSEILTRVWEETFVEEANVSYYVAILRKALSAPAGTNYIETVKTRGYRFAAPVTVQLHKAEDTQPPEIADVKPEIEAVAPDDAAAAPTRSSHRWNARLVGVAAAALILSGVFGVVALVWGRSEPIDSVVVMPFHAIAPDSDQAYLETGIAEAIAMRLGTMTTLRVPPLAAVRRDEGPFEAGQRLATHAVLTGTIQRAGDRLLVTTQLSNVSRGDRLWAWTFDTTVGEILAVQDEIAERISVRLGRAMTPTERAQPRRDTASGEAYDLFLQARERWRRRTPETVRQAIAMYERAIAIDAQFGRAYAGLADCYNITNSGLPPQTRYLHAKANAEKAVSIDPDSAEARTSLAFMRYKFEWRWEDADREFQQAIKLNPRYALAHHWYGEFLGLMDRPDEAIAELKRAQELDPFSLAVRSDMVRPLVRTRRLQEARNVLDEGLQIDPNWYGFPMMMADILLLEGRDRESAEQTWRGMALRSMPADEINELRAAFEKGGMTEMTRAQIRQLLHQEVKPTSSASFIMATNLSLAYGRLGDREHALRWLETAIARREDAAIHLLTHSAYDSIRQEPRFLRLLDQLKLSPYVKP